MGLTLDIADLRVETARGRALLEVPALRVAAGAVTVIAGPSGAGKTTLLYVCAGLLRPVRGRVCWGARDIAGLGDGARTAFRRDTVGFIFQDHLLFEELDALGNAALPAAYAPRAQRPALRRGASAMLERLGLGQALRRGSTVLSGGERQRVAVARALAGDPPVILADEPTASLDRAAADALAEDLFALARQDGRTVLIVSHDTALQRRADKLLHLADGRLAPC